jgi:hypothetical protein
MIVGELCWVYQMFKEGLLIKAQLGDGSKITAVGRPHNWICEVHSDRGIEYRQSNESVLIEKLSEEELSKLKLSNYENRLERTDKLFSRMTACPRTTV